MYDVIIVGAGPYGISLAAYAIQNGLSFKLIGYPMDFWKTKMPQNMFIRTPYELVQFPDPDNKLTIKQFAKETSTVLSDPLPRPIFVEYASWYAAKSGIEFTFETVSSVIKKDTIFSVHTEQGNAFQTHNVVIATGISDYKYLPPIFRGFPDNLVTHTLGHTNFNAFAHKRVAVVGSGQSAWEAAALLHEAGAEVELLFRKERPRYGGSKNQEILLRLIGNWFYKLPSALKKKLHDIASPTVPIARFLRPYVEGKIKQRGSTEILDANQVDRGIMLSLSNGDNEFYNHVIVASGYKISLNKMPFLDDVLKRAITREDNENFPKLNQNFEASIPGLYFAGPLSSHSHGPTFRFILGLKRTAQTIVKSIRNRRLS